MIPLRIRSSLLLRTLLAVVAVAMVVGLLALGAAGRIASRWERAHQREAMEAQVDGVESDASAACFVEDKGLAAQIVTRLVATRNIQGATLRSRTAVLAEASRGDSAPAPGPLAVVRRINSPFFSEVQVGELALVPDLGEAAKLGARTAFLVRMVVLCLTAALALAIALTVQRSILVPIASLSRRLHRLQAETGATLTPPHGHDGDEIGQLVTDVNALVERLVIVVEHERMLSGKLALDQRKMQALLDHVGTGIFVVNGGGTLEAWTPAFVRMLGLESHGLTRGAAVPELFGGCAGQVEQCLARSRANGSQASEILRVQAGEETAPRWFQLSFDPVAADWIQGLLEDVTAFRDATDAAQQRAVRDPLTGVLNRLGMEEALAERFANGHIGLSLMMVDLDHFKQVNDTHGHGAGDEVLRQATGRMSALLRRSDQVARLGGDEFLLILDSLEDETIALAIARKLIDAIGVPISLPSGEWTRVGASIGIVLQESHETPSRQTLLKRADLALYQAKQAGRNCARVFRGEN
jgi:diguanylate cyclase (GGDEF)-like protein